MIDWPDPIWEAVRPGPFLIDGLDLIGGKLSEASRHMLKRQKIREI
jgi:hypothetical protein